MPTAGPSSLARDMTMPPSLASLAPSHRPGSPALSTASSSNVLPAHLPPHLRPSVLVTRKDQAASLAAYEILLGASKAYTQALLTLSGASTHFAHALQQCARLKGAHAVGSQLHAASGLEYLVASHAKLLADGFWKDFSIPLLEAFDEHRRATAERELNHAKVIAEKSRQLKDCEEKNLRGGGFRNGKGKKGLDRDLTSFRRALEELQRLVDGLDEERAGHYVEVLAAEEEEWQRVSSKVSHILRLQVEVHDRLSSKPLSDPILEPMLSAIPDPFNAYSYAPNGNGAGAASSSASSVHQGDGGGAGGGEIFSVLQHSANLAGGSHQNTHTAALDHFNHDGWGTGTENLTPAGLLSPRTPSTGLPRAASSAWGSPSINRTQKSQGGSTVTGRGQGEIFATGTLNGSGSASVSTPSLATMAPSSNNHGGGGGGTGPNGEFSFAALGLTSATHPQISGVGGATSSIGSPLFGSEDGSNDDGEMREEGGVEAGGGGERADDGLGLIDGPDSRPRVPTRDSSSTIISTFGSTKPSTATPAILTSTVSRTRSGVAGAGGGGGLAGGGLARRLKKALSIIDDEAISEAEKRDSLHEAVGTKPGTDVSEANEGEEGEEEEDQGWHKAGVHHEAEDEVGEDQPREADTSGSKHSHGS